MGWASSFHGVVILTECWWAELFEEGLFQDRERDRKITLTRIFCLRGSEADETYSRLQPAADFDTSSVEFSESPTRELVPLCSARRPDATAQRPSSALP
jgi:hypothetical protein